MERIFEDAKDLHVRATVIYLKVTSGEKAVAYYDPELTQGVKASEMFDLYAKGCIMYIQNLNYYAKPLVFATEYNIMLTVVGGSGMEVHPVDAE